MRNHKESGFGAYCVKAYSEFVLSRPWLCIIVTLCVAAGLSLGAKKLDFSTDYRAFFGKTNPQLEAFDTIEKIYSKTDSIVFAIKPKSGSIFTRDCLKLVQEMTDKSWKLPYSQRVDSLANYQHTYAKGDTLIVEDLVGTNPSQLTTAQLTDIETIAMSEPLLKGRVVAQDGAATGVSVVVNLPRKDMGEVLLAAEAARELVAEMRAKYPAFDIHPSGVVMLNDAFVSSAMQDMSTLIPFMYLVLIAVMMLFLRNVWTTLATVLVIAFSAVSAMGFGGWIGIELTPLSASAPTIILTLAIADSIHIILSMVKEMQKGALKIDALMESMRLNFQPVFLTSLTTVIGFLSLNFSDSPPFHDLGNIAAFGISMAFCCSIFFLPAILSLLPFHVKPGMELDKGLNMSWFAAFVIRHCRPILWGSLLVTLGLGAMTYRLEVNDQFVQYFDESVAFRQDSDFMMKNLTGVYTVEFSVGAEAEAGINEPLYLQKLEAFTAWLRAQPEVVHVFSMADIFKRLNKNMHQDNAQWYKVPDTRELAAQYLLLYEFSLPYGLDLNDRINVSKSQSRVTVTLKDMSTKDIRAFKEKAEHWLRANTPPYMHAEATSPVIMFAYISQRNIEGMMTGNFYSLLLISLCIMIALRSFKIGAFSLIPNLVPIAIGYGLWSVIVGQINMAVAVSAAVSLGIIVDDTIHFLSKYFRARREQKLDAADSIRYAFTMVGQALLVTTFILVAGFSMLTLSTFQINVYMGLLTALVIGSAIVADFFLLPTLLLALDKTKGKK